MTALTRQVHEAVLIQRRGGKILNSKSEYNRCQLPRLSVKMGVKEMKKGGEEFELTEDELRAVLEEGVTWKRNREEEMEGRPSKRRKRSKVTTPPPEKTDMQDKGRKRKRLLDEEGEGRRHSKENKVEKEERTISEQTDKENISSIINCKEIPVQGYKVNSSQAQSSSSLFPIFIKQKCKANSSQPIATQAHLSNSKFQRFRKPNCKANPSQPEAEIKLKNSAKPTRSKCKGRAIERGKYDVEVVNTEKYKTPINKTHQGSLAQLEQRVGGRNNEDTKAKKYSQGKITHFLVKKNKEVAGGGGSQNAI